MFNATVRSLTYKHEYFFVARVALSWNDNILSAGGIVFAVTNPNYKKGLITLHVVYIFANCNNKDVTQT